MKFSCLPPFFISRQKFDLSQDISNPTGRKDGSFTDNVRASYRIFEENATPTVKHSEAPRKEPKSAAPGSNHVVRPNEQTDHSTDKKTKQLSALTNNENSIKQNDSPNKRFGVSAGSENLRNKREGISGTSEGQASEDAISHRGEKTEKDRNLIRKAIIDNELLREGMRDNEVMQAVVDAMYLETIPEDFCIIKEGEIGSRLYVCEEGFLEVYKEDQKVNTLGSGTIFGELALLYNTRRNATIKAITPCTLWVLERKDFNHIVRSVGMKRIEEYVNYLRSVPILSKLETDTLIRMTDLLKRANFPSGTIIVKQGEKGNLFYIISAGTVVVTKKLPDGSVKKLEELSSGDFFGEGALKEESNLRGATVTAKTPVECLTLDKEPFIQYLGDLKEVDEEVKKRNAKVMKTNQVSSEYSYIKFEDLDIKGTLGVGGFGRVELVQYKKDKKLIFALKRLKKNHVVEFQQEAHVLNEKNTMMCCKSPFITRLHNTYKNSKYLFFLMEACLGGDVWSLLQKRRFFDENLARFISACVIEAFRYLHDRGIVYRDLKPENLLFDGRGYVKLVDFGFAKKLQPTEKTWTFAGTPEYLAPEIVLNKGHDRAADYWELGVLIYELLVGKPPFRASDHLKTYQLIIKGISSAPFPSIVDRPAENLIRKLCKLEPTERLGYQKEGIDGIKNHRWFSNFDWIALQRTEMKAPFVPKINGPTDLSNFEECPKDKEIPPDETGDWDFEF